jgi:hypothetical protein
MGEKGSGRGIVLLVSRGSAAAAKNLEPFNETSAYDAEHRLEHEVASTCICRLEHRRQGRELMELIREGTSFACIAAQHATDERTANAGGCVGLLRRENVEPELESILFGAALNVPIGPVKTKEGYNIFLISGCGVPPIEQMKDAIVQTLFHQLPARLSASASIEYPWASTQAASAVKALTR